jgi:5-methylcytosine-specific restriction endonuclease McrA
MRHGTTACQICYSNLVTPWTFHAAHIVAHANGGGDTVDNLVVACASCNLSCGTMDLRDFQRLHNLHPGTLTRIWNLVTSWIWW